MKIISLFLIAGLLSCVHQPRDIAGGTSEQGNAFVRGRLLTSTGLPAKGAKVRVYNVRHNPQTGAGKALAIVDSATTNDSGVFTIDTLPADTFNIFGDSGTSLSYVDSIPVGQDTVVIPPDTLEAPGSLTGTIQLRAGDDPRKVLALFFGSTAYALPDSLGRFTLSNLAAGEYSVRFLPSGNIDYAVLDTSLTVNAGQTDTVVVRLRFTGIPTPTGLAVAYDTLKQIVTLTWNREDTALVKGFNFYRRNSGLNGNPAQIGGLVTDTVYRDSTGVQDSTYEYQVAAVSQGNQEGNKSTIVVTRFIIENYLVDSLGVKGSLDNQLFRPQSASSNNNYYVIVDWVDPFPSAIKAKIFDLNGNFIRTFIVRTSSVSDDIINLKCAIDSQNNIWTVFRDTTYKHDISGNLLGKFPLSISEILAGGNAGIVIRLSDSVLITSSNANNVLTRNLSGDTVSQFFIDGSYGGVGAVMNIDANGNCFLSSFKNGYRILKCDPSGNVLSVWDSTISIFMKFNVIRGILTDSLGRIFIDDAENSRVVIFNDTGSYLGQFETFLNTKKWRGTNYDESQHRALFLNSNSDICILESYNYSKLFIFRIPLR